jgi:transposase
MQFIGVDLHTNKFTCSYRDEQSSPDTKKGKRTETITLDAMGLSAFYMTLTPDTYVLVEATITTFAFVRLIEPLVWEVIAADTYELKQIGRARNNTDKIDANILSGVIRMHLLSGEQVASPVTVAPVEIGELRSLFTTYRLYDKQIVRIKNRIQLYGFTQEEIFDMNSRRKILSLDGGSVMAFQLEELFTLLEHIEARMEPLKEKITERAELYDGDGDTYEYDGRERVHSHSDNRRHNQSGQF